MILKLLFVAFIFIIGLIFGLMPYKINSCRTNRSVLSVANAFCGGIFLAIALLHIIPESHTHYLEYLHRDEFPESYSSHQHVTSSEHQGVMLGGKYRNLHGIDKSHKLLDIGFPLPYFTVFVGYTLILLIDKVLFESHSLEHEHIESFRNSVSRQHSHSHVRIGF